MGQGFGIVMVFSGTNEGATKGQTCRFSVDYSFRFFTAQECIHSTLSPEHSFTRRIYFMQTFYNFYPLYKKQCNPLIAEDKVKRNNP